MRSPSSSGRPPETETEGGLDRGGGGLTQAADGGVGHHQGKVVEPLSLFGESAQGTVGGEAGQGLLLSDRANPAGNALTAGLIPEELGDSA